MDTFKKVIRYVFTGGLIAWLIFIGVITPTVTTLADETTSSSSSTNSGQNLYDAFRAIYGDSSSSSSSKSSSSSCVTVEQLMKRMETEPIGPKVQDTSLSESYHEDYKVYEERLGENILIYANVQNGTVTNRPVVIDVPRGVGTSMKRDGSDVPFVSKQVIDQEGSYILYFFVGSDVDTFTSFSEQTYLRAQFRFRIQKGEGVGGVVGEGDFDEEEEEEKPVEEETPEEPDQDLLAEELLNEEAETETETESTVQEPEVKKPEGADLGSSYDNSSGYYTNTLRTGETFLTNVPNGTITNDPVIIQESTGLEYRAFRNGAEFEEFAPGQGVNEDGSYAIYISKPDDEDFLRAYPFGNPAFRFRIVRGYVSDIGIITAPYGVSVRNVRYNGLDADDSVFIDERTVHVDRNGDYEITFDDASGSRELAFTLDTEQPVFTVAVEPNLATVKYYSNDVTRCVLYRGEKVISDPQIVDSVTKSGKYRLVVFDAAGNSSESEFSVRYRINAAAVIAILAVIGIIAGVLIYVLRMKKNVKVV